MKVLRFANVVSKGLAAGKRVFIRADLNVPQEHSAAGGGRITEDARIRAWVPCSADAVKRSTTMKGRSLAPRLPRSLWPLLYQHNQIFQAFA